MKKIGSLFLVAVLVLTMLCSCNTVQPNQEPIEKTLGVSVSDIKNLMYFEDIDFKTKVSNSQSTVCSGIFNKHGNNIEIDLHYENSTQEVFRIVMWGDPGDRDNVQAYVNGLADIYIDYVVLLNSLLSVLDTSVSDAEKEQIYDMLAPLDEEHQMQNSGSFVLNDIEYQKGIAGEYGFEIQPAK